MDRLLIVADDLTGACDSGVKFSGFGCKTRVIMPTIKSFSFDNDTEVFSCCTDTRNLSKDKAYNVIKKLLNNVPGDLFLYKKIDSTLRGNIISEIQPFLDLGLVNYVIISSSYPETGRTVLDGKLNVKLGDIFETYDVSDKIGLKNGCHISLNTIRKGKDEIKKVIEENKECKYFIADSLTKEDLDVLAQVAFEDKKCLPVGSAGLANSLGELIFKNDIKEEPIIKNLGKTMFVVGTKNPVTVKQVHRLTSLNICSYVFDITDLSREPKMYNEDKADKGVLITLNNVYGSCLDENYSLKQNIHNNDILEILSNKALDVAKNHEIKTYVLSGGDVAGAVLEKLNISNIELLYEPLPGIALGRAIDCTGKEIFIITKSGGFGKDDTLVELFNS